MKWSSLEDRVLTNGYRLNINWEDEGKYFLPMRSLGSLEARWRRIGKANESSEQIVNRMEIRKECMRKIALRNKGIDLDT